MGNPLPGRRFAASGPSSRHLWKAGSVTTYTLPPSFSSVAGFGGPKLTWLRQKASSPKPGSRGVPLAVGNSPPRLALVTCYVSLLHSQVKGESHAFVDRGLTHRALQVPIVGRPPYLNQSSYRSLGPIAGKARLQNRTWSFSLIRLL